MTPEISLIGVLHRRVLTSRETARDLADEISYHVASGERPVSLDFSGIDGLSPSFFDELLAVAEEATRKAGESAFEVTLVNPPEGFLAKLAPILRSRNLIITHSANGQWSLRGGERSG